MSGFGCFILQVEFIDLNHCFFLFSLQAVQKDILHSGVQSKADKSPVTVADYGTIRPFISLRRFLRLMLPTEFIIGMCPHQNLEIHRVAVSHCIFVC